MNKELPKNTDKMTPSSDEALVELRKLFPRVGDEWCQGHQMDVEGLFIRERKKYEGADLEGLIKELEEDAIRIAIRILSFNKSWYPTVRKDYKRIFRTALTKSYASGHAAGERERKEVKVTAKDSIGKDEMYCEWFKCSECKDSMIYIEAKFCSNCGAKLKWQPNPSHQ